VSHPQRSKVTRIGAAFALALGLFIATFAAMASPASAQASNCRISDFRNPDGTLDITSYLACIRNATGNNGGTTGGTNTGTGNLPGTGSDTGQLIGLGTVLVVLGAAATFGSRSLRTANASADDSDLSA
jgi:hypothetical protein